MSIVYGLPAVFAQLKRDVWKGGGTNWKLTHVEVERTSSFQLLKPVALASLFLLLFFVWLERFTSLTNILVTAYYFTLRLTQQSITRSGNPSVHATCSQTCSRGHFASNTACWTKETEQWHNLISWSETWWRRLHSHISFPFCHLGTNRSSLKVERLKRDHLHNGLSFAGSHEIL